MGVLVTLTTLPYHGTIEGKILKLIVIDDLRDWRQIRDHFGWTNKQLEPYIELLEKKNIINQISGQFKVDYNLWLQYKAHYGKDWAKKILNEL